MCSELPAVCRVKRLRWVDDPSLIVVNVGSDFDEIKFSRLLGAHILIDEQDLGTLLIIKLFVVKASEGSLLVKPAPAVFPVSS